MDHSSFILWDHGPRSAIVDDEMAKMVTESSCAGCALVKKAAHTGCQTTR
jgi:hypothetical protein